MVNYEQAQQAERLRQLLPTAPAVDSFYSDYVNYDIPVPLEYWRQGNNAIPDDARERVRQLEVYWDLYQGEYGAYFPAPLSAKMNYHFMLAERLANFLMQYPPEFNFDYADMVSERFIQQLNKELPNVLIDLVRFGIGLFNVVNTERGAEVQAPLPIHWFPIDGDSDCLLIVPAEKDEPYTLFVHFMNGELEIRQYENDAGKLGKRLRNTISERFGNEAAWNALAEVSIGRIGPIIPVALEPTAGDWGRSQYFDVTALIFELNRRLSGNSEILTEHGNPRLKVIPNEVPAHRGQGLDDSTLIKTYTEQTRLDSLRKSNVMLVPRGYTDVDYLFWPGTLDDHFHQFDKVQEQMFALTHLPLSLLNVDGSMTIPASGRALRFQFIDTHTHVQKVQTQLINRLKQAILTGAIYNGAVNVADMAGRIDITWRNIFDEIDESGVVEMSAGDDAEVVPDGEVDQPFQGEEAV